MRIGIDISQLAYEGTGVATYTRNLVESLLKIDKENEYCLFFSTLRGKFPILALPPEKSNFQIKNLKLPPLLLESLWNRLHVLPIENFVGQVDLFHTSDWLEPPAKCPKITTIHDLVVYKYPQTLPPRIVANQKRKLEWVKRESRIIIAVSKSTKRDIVEILKIPEGRIRVIYEAGNTDNTKKDINNTEIIKKKYGIEGKYLLAVGTREPRKNLQRIIEAHNLLISQYPNLQLVIVGKYGWGGEDSNMQINKYANIKILGYMPTEDLNALYAGAEVFVYPSLYEGFGLPIFDAMSFGCPVVTSNVSSMPEVTGNAGILVDPESVEDIANGIEKAMKESKSLVEKGHKRVMEFSWGKTARETLKVYEEAYRHR